MVKYTILTNKGLFDRLIDRRLFTSAYFYYKLDPSVVEDKSPDELLRLSEIYKSRKQIAAYDDFRAEAKK